MSNEPAAPTGEVRLECDGPIAWIIVDNPARRNAVNYTMWRQMTESVAAADADPAVRVMVIRGGGEENFISGADISEFENNRNDAKAAQDYEGNNGAAFAAIRDAKKPTIAMIRGFCMGGGVGVAVACDLRIAAEGSIYAVPAAKLGVGYPPNAFADVVNLVGPSAAKMLYFSAGRIDHTEALRVGLVDKIVAADALQETTADLAKTISINAPLTIHASKAAINALCGDPAEINWDELNALRDICFNSEDFAEGRRAFMEKRKPVFKGR